MNVRIFATGIESGMIVTNAVNCSSTAVACIMPSTEMRVVIVQNVDYKRIYIGDINVTPSTGLEIGGGGSFEGKLHPGRTWYIIRGS